MMNKFLQKKKDLTLCLQIFKTVAESHLAGSNPAALRQLGDSDWIRKEVSALIQMTLEFVYDEDMKMRDVRRVEKYYYGLEDFGAARIFTAIENKFEHMCTLYKNTSRIEYILDDAIDLRSQAVGMLQFMLSDYMEILSLIDLFKERYAYWKATSREWQIRDKIEKFLIAREVYPENFERRIMWLTVIYAQNDPLSLDWIYLQLRKEKTTKDADMIIKMTSDFVRDMQQKLELIGRLEKTYSVSSDYTTGLVFSDIQRKFKHMCDLYKQYATVRNLVMGESNSTFELNRDVVIIFQIMLSDFNEILMLIELFKVEQLAWREGVEKEKTRDLIKKQMIKFGNIPAKITPPQLVKDDPKATMGQDKKIPRRQWGRGDGPDYPQKWSGELDGVTLSER